MNAMPAMASAPNGSFADAQLNALPHPIIVVTREGHIYSRHSLSFHAPDSELHGVLSRQREIEVGQDEQEDRKDGHEADEGLPVKREPGPQPGERGVGRFRNPVSGSAGVG